jgi:hypothetical protein
VPKSKNAWSYNPLLQYAFMVWCSFKKKHRDNLYKPPEKKIQMSQIWRRRVQRIYLPSYPTIKGMLAEKSKNMTGEVGWCII